jgi:hypothetical protein
LNGYRVEFIAKAERQFEKLPVHMADRLLEKAHSLAQNPRPPGVKKLEGVPIVIASAWEIGVLSTKSMTKFCSSS